MTTPTIPAGNLFMNATTYTGTGAAQTITNGVAGQAFQPDLVWVKNRSAVAENTLTDSVRGVNAQWFSNLINADQTNSTYLTSFNTNGFSMNGGNSATGDVNTNGNTFVAWQWKAGGTAVSNTNGSTTSSVSANTTAGFSVLTYTGTGAVATIGHGLSAVPQLIIVHRRDSTSGQKVYSPYLTSGYILELYNSGAQSVNAVAFNSTTPTSSVFSVGNYADTNASGGTFVAYCWAPIAGYSAFGSYTGNGSTDGPFVYLGFRPRFIMTKSYDATAGVGDWTIHDTSRNTYNAADLRLFANSSAAESSSEAMDMNSNGFKIRATNSNCNTSGGGYIYAAFAENPFKYALAR